MVKPLVYSVGDTKYCNLYGGALFHSAKKHGLDCHIVNGGDIGRDACWLRWKLLPELLNQFSAVLMVDMDSVFRAPIEIDGHWDMGLMLRPHAQDPYLKVFLGAAYFTPTVMPIVEEMARLMSEPELLWCVDQKAIYELYLKHVNDYRTMVFDKAFLNWRLDTDPKIFSPKGAYKHGKDYKKILGEYA